MLDSGSRANRYSCAFSGLERPELGADYPLQLCLKRGCIYNFNMHLKDMALTSRSNFRFDLYSRSDLYKRSTKVSQYNMHHPLAGDYLSNILCQCTPMTIIHLNLLSCAFPVSLNRIEAKPVYFRIATSFSYFQRGRRLQMKKWKRKCVPL
jgi:hypothetical protein